MRNKTKNTNTTVSWESVGVLIFFVVYAIYYFGFKA